MQLNIDDFNNATSKILPASFPKGFKAFYCMKYEISQEQYMVFLNKLNYTQQAIRTQLITPPNSPAGTNVLTFFGTPYRNGVDVMVPGVDPGTPAVYACNLNNNGTYNEPDDGQNIACNNISWGDMTAYLDWAALRPMTELEFEKACRGNQAPVAEEFAWGNTNINFTSGVINNGMASEAISDPNANCNNSYWDPAQGGPVRVGCFGQGTGTRQATGGSYFGLMEMSGNLWERTITVGSPAGRTFTGVHGDGKLTNVLVLGIYEIGDANVPGWPLSDAIGSGFRGGSWFFPDPQAACISNRIYGSSDQNISLLDYGGRGVRTAPY
jgi:formylglycine-generating enzyme required for sulfatase activity